MPPKPNFQRSASETSSPLMLLHCTACHGQRIQEAGLDLRSRAAMLKGGTSGPAIVPGKPEKSLIVQRIRAREMPPSEREVEASLRPMSAPGLEQLVRWISLGAPEVNGEDRDEEKGSDPLVSEEGPPLLVLPAAESNRAAPVGLGRAIPAAQSGGRLHCRQAPGKRTQPLARGRPPDADPARQFRPDRDAAGTRGGPALLADPDPAAYEALIERLLDSPRYGERWGRHWLDLAGYSDRRHAWRYRDYVIRSLNAGKPYDRFLLEQLAGDELADLSANPSSLGKPWTT